MVALLQRAGKFRATARTCMNETSSRSHAVCTITVEQEVNVDALDTSSGRPGPSGHSSDSPAPLATVATSVAGTAPTTPEPAYRVGKFSLVDLAGSEVRPTHLYFDFLRPFPSLVLGCWVLDG